MPSFTQKIQELQRLLSQAKNLLLTTSNNPDADGLGSLLAFYQGLKNYLPSKRIYSYIPEIPPHLKFLSPNIELSSAQPLAEIECLLTFDIGDLKRLPSALSSLQRYQVINIDHHQNSFPPSCLNIIRADYPSTTQIVFELFKTLKWKIDKEIATSLLAGLIYDTASFQHSNTTPRTLEVAAQLMREGANLYKISQNILNYKMPLSYLKAWGDLLQKAKKKRNGLIVSALSRKELEELNAQNAEFSPVANLLSMVPNTKYSLVLIEKERGEIKGSLRTERNRGIDVAKIAKNFGGGGHRLAAGFTINGRLYETREGWKIIKLT